MFKTPSGSTHRAASTRTALLLALLLTLTAHFGLSLSADGPTPTDGDTAVWPKPDVTTRVAVSARFSPATVQPGESATLEVRVATWPNWHVYSLTETQSYPTRLDPLEKPAAWKVGDWIEPEAHATTMAGFDKPLMTHGGQILFQRKVEIPADFATGEFRVNGAFQYQICDDRTCLIPNELPYAATLTVAAAGKTVAGSGETPPGTDPPGSRASGDASAAQVDGGKPAKADTAEKIDIEIDPRRQFGAAVDTDPAKIAPGGEAVLRVHMECGFGWHIYTIEAGDPNIFHTRFTVDELPEGFTWVDGKDWTGPEAHPYAQPGLPPAMVYDGRVMFTRPFRIADSVAAGTYTIRGKVSAMACDALTCLAPSDIAFETTVEVAADAAAAPTVAYDTTGSTSAPVSVPSGAGEGLLKLLVTAILGAMVSWIMPCVYPMIPITISFFGKLAEEKKTNKTAVAMSYGFGIAGTFIGIGLIVGLLTLFVADASSQSGYASLGNTIATNAWVNLLIGIVFILFALTMFGVFTIQVPGWLLNKTDSAGRASGSAHIGAILLGITFALASFTCTVPVVGLLLGLAASGTASSVATSLLGMVIYGVVFAAPFVLLSLFPSAVSSLPKAGSWMDTVKIGFGFLELAVAIKFLWVPDIEWGIGVLTRPVVLVAYIVIGVAAAAYFLGLLKIGHSRAGAFRVSPGRWVAAMATVLILTPVGMSLLAAPSYQARNIPGWTSIGLEVLLPPPPIGDELARKEGWFVDEYDAALARARKDGRPLFIDFTGVYCGNCRAMENAVFPEPPVHEKLEQMVLTRLYVDRPEPKHTRFARMQVERWGVASQPYYVVLDPFTEETLAADGGFITTNKFADFLQGGLDLFEERRATMASQ